jgi:hypothetical protein
VDLVGDLGEHDARFRNQHCFAASACGASETQRSANNTAIAESAKTSQCLTGVTPVMRGA